MKQSKELSFSVTSRVATNIVSNQDLLISSVISGKWDYVLEQVWNWKLSFIIDFNVILA